MKDKVEAILFAAGRFVDEDHIAKLLGEDIRKVRKALEELQAAYEKRGEESSLRLVHEERSWKLHVKDTYLDLVSKLVSDKEIATTVLETLAIIAWRNPAMQAELIKIRGPAAYEHVTELIERGYITKEASGRSFKLKVTDKFFEYFDIEGRDDLKKLFKGVEEAADQKQAEIDKQKQSYEEKKKIADAAAAALAAGKELTPEERAKLENSVSAASAHSAQTAPLPSKEDVQKAVQELSKETKIAEAAAELKPEKKQLLKELKGDLDELKKELDAVRDKQQGE
jgi:segregation and condensation protein B